MGKKLLIMQKLEKKYVEKFNLFSFYQKNRI